MQVKKIFTYTIDELPMKVQNKVIIEGLVRLGEVFSRNGVYIADEVMKPDTTGV